MPDLSRARFPSASKCMPAVRRRTYMEYQIIPEEDGQVLYEYLRKRGFSHRLTAQLKRLPDGICVNHCRTRAVEILHAGDILTVQLPPDETDGLVIEPVDLPLNVVYEDADILVVDKPAGMPVHPTSGHRRDTLANAVAWHCLQLDDSFSFHCCNRLDRDTSGLILLSRHALSAAVISCAMADRQIHRTYQAIVKGRLTQPGTVHAPISREAPPSIRRYVDYENGVTAVTHYKPLSYREDLDLTLLELSLETGRTHQIRVHMLHTGHPLIGDELYYPDLRLIGRQALHSQALSFLHPVTGAPLRFTSPLPEDMARIMH